MIKTINLGRRYGSHWAVQDLNLGLEGGEIYGLLGPNGAGKTTIIMMLLSILKPTTGQVYLFGQPIQKGADELHMRIGVVPEKQCFYPEMTLREYLRFFGTLYRVSRVKNRIEEIADQLDISSYLDWHLRAFSRGMQQKAAFARAFLHDPELLILDEPTSGLDPIGVRQIRALIKQGSERGRTYLISSHMLSEVEKVCQKAAIISKGRLLIEDTMENLVHRVSNEIELNIEFLEDAPRASQVLEGRDFIKKITTNGRYLTATVRNDRDYRRDVVEILIANEIVPVSLYVKSFSLEDAFLALIK